MPSPFPNAYTHNHKVFRDGSLVFECAQDETIWPWLVLPPTHQIVVQSANFWASVESGMTLGTFDPNKWSALVQVEWTCGQRPAGKAVTGRYSADPSTGSRQYRLAFFDAQDRLIVELSGRGVVFRTRNFESWRDEGKERVLRNTASKGFKYAPSETVGVANQKLSFLSPLRNEGGTLADGLITKNNGLMPDHPYIGGSGDHVNSTHMGEVGRQFGALLTRPEIEITSGHMKFVHYVELGRPFQVDLINHDISAGRFELVVRQADRDCTRIQMSYDVSD